MKRIGLILQGGIFLFLFLIFSAFFFFIGYSRGVSDCEHEQRADSLQTVINEMPEKYIMIERGYE